jgi:hypothetical protein
MTTYYQFTPSNSVAPSFMPILDGLPYNVSIVWNVSGQRYYVKCVAQDGTLVFLVPLVESNDPLEIADLSWDKINKRVVATTAAPHGLIIGQSIMINIINTKPDAYDGSGFGAVLSKTQFYYPMLQDPGQVIRFGVLDRFISMTKGYFNSTLVYRHKRFEVTP